MTTTEALRIIQALADRRDPTDGKPLKEQGICHQPDVVQALSIAVNALERLEKREKREAAWPENVGRGWSGEEDEQVCVEFEAGKSVKEIATLHKRTRGAIQSRLQRLGKIVLQRPDQPKQQV